MVNWTCSRWQLSPTIVTADARYGTAPNIAGLEQAGIKAFIPIPDNSKRTKYYHSDLFLYNAEDNHYVCPQGEILKLYTRRNSEQVFVYRANAQVCNACAVKHRCTKSKSGRHIFRSFFLEYIERVKGYHETEEYKKSMRKRGVWVEPLFGEAKQFHRLSRFRLRRLKKVNIEGLMIAAGQNLKRLLKFSGNIPIESLIICISMIENILLNDIDRPWSRSRLNGVKCFSTGCYVLRHDLGFVGHEKVMISLSRNDYEPDICYFNKEETRQFTPNQMRFPAPDFVVEVLSDRKAANDRGVKFEDYAAHGIVEY